MSEDNSDVWFMEFFAIFAVVGFIMTILCSYGCFYCYKRRKNSKRRQLHFGEDGTCFHQQPGMKISFESASNSPNIRIPNKSENEIEMERLFLNFEENDTYLKKTEKNYY
ncbi:hypothetical protein Avbf_02845 [Armadillidium vulgare]|nr:hypothetical protein Avbf_02845 [Armadillidium vulgare]